MARRLSRDQRGFTLIEVLIVILVIAILAAIAIPTFLGKRSHADDADAKSNARNLVSFVDSCYTRSEDYSKCATQAETEEGGIPWGDQPGQAQVTIATKTSYTVEAISLAKTDGVNHTFSITRTADGAMVRTCHAGTSDNAGGCKSGVW